MNGTTNELGERIRKARWAKDLTLRQLSKECKVAVSTLSRIENGGSPEGWTLFRISRVLDLDIDELLTLAEELVTA